MTSLEDGGWIGRFTLRFSFRTSDCNTNWLAPFYHNGVCLVEGCVQIEQVVGMDGIGGELVVPCTTNRLYGGPNAFGRRKRPFGFHTRTLMSRPHMTRVPRTVPGGEQ